MQQWQLSHKIFAFYTFCNPSENMAFSHHISHSLAKRGPTQKQAFSEALSRYFHLKTENLNPTAR